VDGLKASGLTGGELAVGELAVEHQGGQGNPGPAGLAPGGLQREQGQLEQVESDSPELPELMVVGKVVAAQGLQGELRLLPLSDFPQRFTKPGRRWLQRRQDPPRPVELRGGRQLPGKQLYVVRLGGVESREAAEALVGEQLLVLASDRPKLAQGEFHLLDLVGLEVRLLEQGQSIGRVLDLLHAGNDLLEVELNAEWGARVILIPFVTAIVPEVHIQAGWIGLTPPPGLLEL
jgi:16S rRNA processing protein RimM